MPLYEYHCRRCNAGFELLVRTGETPACPSCGGVRLEKLLSVPAAPVTGSSSLPICRDAPPAAGCGRPQCGMGGCAM